MSSRRLYGPCILHSGDWRSNLRAVDILSWVDTSGLPVHVVRYEDMVLRTVPTFTEIVRFAGLEVDAARVDKALAFSSFDRLQAMERAEGFRERAPRASAFFRKGKIGDWRDALTEDQVEQLIGAHRDVMARFGYLTEDGVPIF